MTVVVTGASGHLGNNLVRELLDRGEDVRALYLGSADSLDGLPIDKIEVDVRNKEAIKKALAGADVVYHLAGIISTNGDPTGIVHAVNVDGTRNMAEAAREEGVSRFVHCGSIHSFQHAPPGQTIDETSPRSLSENAAAYDRSKAEGEQIVKNEAKAGLNAVVVHPTGVIGPYDYIPSKMGKLLMDMGSRKFMILPKGSFDWVDARDVASGLIAAAEKGKAGESYIASGNFQTMRSMINLVKKVTGLRVPRLEIPMWLASAWAPIGTFLAKVFGTEPQCTKEALEALKGEQKVSHKKATQELGYQPRPTGETLKDFYEWCGTIKPDTQTGSYCAQQQSPSHQQSEHQSKKLVPSTSA